MGSRTPRKRRALVLTVGMVGLVVLSACGGSGYKWVGSTDAGAYFKVPSNWEDFHKDEILRLRGDGDSVLGSESLRWYIAFDSAPRPSIEHVLGDFADYPVVEAQVRTLTFAERDSLALEDLRNRPYPIDELTRRGQADVVEYQHVAGKGGIYGFRMVVNIAEQSSFRVSPTSRAVRVLQITLVDPTSSLLYLFVIKCHPDCFAANRQIIDQVAASWTVQGATR